MRDKLNILYSTIKLKFNWKIFILFLLVSPVVFFIGYSFFIYLTFDASDLVLVEESGTLKRVGDGVIQVEYLGDPANIIPVKYEDIPRTCVIALVAAEDRSYFSNQGYNITGMARAIYDEFAKDNYGGSSITQQVIKVGTSRYFNRNLIDKHFETIAAYKLTEQLSKEEILEIYMNNVYMGNFNYGIGSAAKNYFNKDVKDLNLAECAYLMGLPQQPSIYNPFVNPDLGIERQYTVLNLMLLRGEITGKEFKEAIVFELKFTEPHILLSNIRPDLVTD